MIKALQKGDIVASKMGHDTNRLYVVIAIENEFAFVADGDYRLLSNPKKKRLKHLRYINTTEFDDKITDTILKRIIKLSKLGKQN